MVALEVLVDGLMFPEGPRWRDGRLWFSDFYSHRVLAVGLDGVLEDMAKVPSQPSGLGWLPDGRLLVVSMLDRRVLRREPDGSLVLHADLSAHATGPCNDMVVDGAGRAWVGNFGFDRHAGEEPATTVLVRVDPDGAVTPAADDVFFPNGSVVSPDGATLVVGETWRQRLTAWDIRPDGSLANRRTWADIAPHWPDGICLDAEGAIWVADPRGNVVVRVHEGGEISARAPTGDLGAFACMLGGAERRTLFVCTCSGSGPHAAARTDGRIELTEVDVPGAGWP
ncbi:MAG: gluconolactonase [Acidimicrobiia bacterium]|nr:gluconolactonase [Acidimicrobiia bacterium]